MIDKAFVLISVLQGDATAMRLSDLSRRTRLPKSTTHRMLHALIDAGVVERNGTLYQIAVKDTKREPSSNIPGELIRGVAPYLGDLLMHTRLTTSLATLNGRDVEFLQRVYGHQDLWLPSDESGRGPALDTAAGRALLAYDRAAALRAAQLAGLGPDDVAQLDGKLMGIRQNGYSVGHHSCGATCLAVPLLLPGCPALALTVRGSTKSVDHDRTLYWLRRVADIIMRELRRDVILAATTNKPSSNLRVPRQRRAQFSGHVAIP
ncbi:IclR family transcriptional regulator [Saccharopolyspora hattusasensis]|uniref:IclR family transcriptional regulator n=1 Tax=Saccharopolyspora hattusasensis TaxID=1128679 RepID=UPI003D982514